VVTLTQAHFNATARYQAQSSQVFSLLQMTLIRFELTDFVRDEYGAFVLWEPTRRSPPLPE